MLTRAFCEGAWGQELNFEGWQLIWHDEFDETGTFNRERWQAEEGNLKITLRHGLDPLTFDKNAAKRIEKILQRSGLGGNHITTGT